MKVIPLKIARPDEVPLLGMAGYQVVGPWGDTFTLMRLARETAEPNPTERYGFFADVARDQSAWRDTVGEDAR